MSDDYAIEVKGMTKRFGDLTAVNHIDLRGSHGRDLRFSWSERERQNNIYSDALRVAQRR